MNKGLKSVASKEYTNNLTSTVKATRGSDLFAHELPPQKLWQTKPQPDKLNPPLSKKVPVTFLNKIHEIYLKNDRLANEGAAKMITTYLRNHDWQDGVAFICQVAAAKIPVNSIHLGIVIKACVDSGNWQEALKIYALLKMAKMPLNGVIYNDLVLICIKHQQLQKLHSLIQEMQSLNIFLSRKIYLLAIAAYEANQQPKLAQDLRQEIEELCLPTIIYCDTKTITASSETYLAAEVVFQLQALVDANVAPETAGFSAYLKSQTMGKISQARTLSASPWRSDAELKIKYLITLNKQGQLGSTELVAEAVSLIKDCAGRDEEVTSLVALLANDAELRLNSSLLSSIISAAKQTRSEAKLEHSAVAEDKDSPVFRALMDLATNKFSEPRPQLRQSFFNFDLSSDQLSSPALSR